MAHLIYDFGRQVHNDSADHDHRWSTGSYNPGFNGGFVVLALVMVLMLLFWGDLPRLESDLNAVVIPAVKNTVTRQVAGPVRGPIASDKYVAADSLNMRVEPIDDARVNFVLPRGTKVTLLGESHQAIDGDVWLKVSVETFEGRQVGWVRQRYVA